MHAPSACDRRQCAVTLHTPIYMCAWLMCSQACGSLCLALSLYIVKLELELIMNYIGAPGDHWGYCIALSLEFLTGK